ncbi:MAG: carboxypeptidase-like regulatory domain-containing protein [Prevotella sp.]|jgi:hypothetical protein|nr:carboxypeptidase-like regulatory domain-containing protein [Prevotella sp.]
MRSAVENTLHRILACILSFFVAIVLQADDGGVLNRKIQLPKSKETIYKLLRQVSDKSGYLFIYDSQIIENNKEVKISKGEYTVREAIYTITGNRDLKMTVIGNHILLRLSEAKREASSQIIEMPPKPTNNDYMMLSGVINDQITDEPLSYSGIGVNNTTIGTISNQNGEFKLILPDSLRDSVIKLSHLGYQSQEIEVSLLDGHHIRFALEPLNVPLQEIVVRAIDPLQEIKLMLEKQKDNYPSSPAYLTTFYREGINYKKKDVDITEAVLKVYKTGYQNDVNLDQAKLVKMRRINNVLEKDTIFAKMKSGINSTLTLDIMKNSPDFLTPDEQRLYDYTHTDISVIDGRRVNVISFEQKEYITDPLYKGQLFIDAENHALVEVRFEVNPVYAAKATNQYVEKKNKDIHLTLKQACYTVSYKLFNDSVYYINHIRGDVDFKVTNKHRLFSSPLRFWFETVNCKVDTNNVTGFSRKERLATHNIFSETKYKYDENFWGAFNVILPEEKLKELIINNLSEISGE